LFQGLGAGFREPAPFYIFKVCCLRHGALPQLRSNSSALNSP